MMYCQLEPLKSMYMVTGPQRTQIFVFQKKSGILLYSLGSCDHIQWFQWLQLTIHHWYVTLVGCQMHWNKQKDSQVILEPIRFCTILPRIYYIIRFCTRLPWTHCIDTPLLDWLLDWLFDWLDWFNKLVTLWLTDSHTIMLESEICNHIQKCIAIKLKPTFWNWRTAVSV